jgi:hypothetical protein
MTTPIKDHKYQGRGIHNVKLYKSLTEGKLKEMIDVVRNDDDLDIQIRNNYLNIYYKGGNIARVKSENSVEFDKFYFYLDSENKDKKNIKNNKKICEDLKSERNLLLKNFKEGKYLDYFSKAKIEMDKYNDSVKKKKNERMEQHILSAENQYNKSEYTIIDLEYEVSINSEFRCKYIPMGKVEPKKPKFDIIAVHKSGKLCVIEFKKGIGALFGSSGLKEHWDCYELSIGYNTQPFMEEMIKLLEQKQTLNLIDKELKIIDPEPKFMFAYSYDKKNTPKEQDEAFEDEYKKIGAQIKVLKLKKGIYKLED